MKQPSQNHNQTPRFSKHPVVSCHESDSEDTEYHLDFLDKIEADLEANPLNEHQKAQAKVLEVRSKLNKMNKHLANAKTLKVSKHSLKINKKPKICHQSTSASIISNKSDELEHTEGITEEAYRRHN
jgi:hypothetical protein